MTSAKYVLGELIALIFVALVTGCSNAEIDRAWNKKRGLLGKYGERFAVQQEIVEVLKKSDGTYAMTTKRGDLIGLDFRLPSFTLENKVGVIKKTNEFAEVSKWTGLSKETVQFWIESLSDLDTLLISKQELPGCNGVHISSYSTAPLLMVPATGWFYVPKTEPHRNYCVDRKGFAQRNFGYNDYFAFIKPLSEEWYYGERK